MDDTTPEAPQRANLEQLQRHVEQMRQEAARLIVGQRKMIDLLLAAILADGHVLIEGVPGVAKTLTAKVLSRMLEVNFSRIQFTPDLMPSDVSGTNVYNAKTGDFEFRRGPIFANVVLIDEINRAPAKTQAALFEVMEERQLTMDGHTYPMEPPFLVIATQNPIEQEGTYLLPEAQLDRFLFKIVVEYPSLDEEEQVVAGFHQRRDRNDLRQIQRVMPGEAIAALREQVALVQVEQTLLRYIAQLVQATRNHPSLFLGASPRASIALLVGAKALAAIDGRDYVTPDDIQEVTLPVLRHRIQLTPEREMEGTTPDEVIKAIVSQVEVPR